MEKAKAKGKANEDINPFEPQKRPKTPVKQLNALEWTIVFIVFGLTGLFCTWLFSEDPVDRQQRIERNKWCNQEPSCPKFYGEPYPEK